MGKNYETNHNTFLLETTLSLWAGFNSVEPSQKSYCLYSLIMTTKQETPASLRWLAFLVLSLTCLVCNEQALKASVNGRNA